MENKYLKQSIELAKKGTGFTSPNPIVGAVIVKNNKIIGTGWHKKAGRDHAEVVAIKDVKNKKDLINSTLYVTLEPCCYFGKTPPCTDLIVKSGIKKVYVGMIDPSKKVNGGGIKYLRKNGVQVEICKDKKLVQEIKQLNQSFIKTRTVGLPYVVLKAGMSLDGKIATKTGNSKWITSEKSRKDARLERSLCDAVLIGSRTVKADNPKLAPHGKFKNKKLLRIILDSNLSTDLNSKVYRDENVFVACTTRANSKNKNKFEKKGVEFKSFGKNKISIKTLLKFLNKKGIQKIFVEGGSEIHGSFYNLSLKESHIIDEILFYIAPNIIGGDGLSVIGGRGVDQIKKGLKPKEIQINKIDKDIKYRGIINKY